MYMHLSSSRGQSLAPGRHSQTELSRTTDAEGSVDLLRPHGSQRKRSKKLLTLLVIFFAGCAGSGKRATINVIPVPIGHGEWRSNDGPFTALFFFSDNPEEFYRIWHERQIPNISTLNRITTGKYFEAIVIFTNCVADKNGNCQITSDWTIKASDGRVVGETKGVKTWVNRLAGRPDELLVAEHGIGFVPERGFTGNYIFEAVVRDEIGTRKVALRREIQVAADK